MSWYGYGTDDSGDVLSNDQVHRMLLYLVKIYPYLTEANGWIYSI